MPPADELDYEQILAAVQETARGRWFLAEFARRNRLADTSAVLDAVAKLEERLENALPQRGSRGARQIPALPREEASAILTARIAHMSERERLAFFA